ncbi:uncharacterized protein LOC127849056 [Dreissena polymorpha]|nr:uncharacterized protein LOC127849056 [Dreissena polymorpha]
METTIMLLKLLGLLSLTIDTRSCSFLDWNGDVHNTFNDGPSARRQRRNVTMADDALTSENVTQYANVSTTSVPKPQWWHDLYSDKYYGSKQYLERKLFTDNPDKEPTICFNNNTLHNKGVTLGRFVCPMANQSDTFVHCCGKSKEQQCCSQKKEHADETESITDELV